LPGKFHRKQRAIYVLRVVIGLVVAALISWRVTDFAFGLTWGWPSLLIIATWIIAWLAMLLSLQTATPLSTGPKFPRLRFTIGRTPNFYPVWFGTNRLPSSDPGEVYSATWGAVVHHGSCIVEVPKSHLFGSLRSSPWRRFWMRVKYGEDDSLTLYRADALSAIDFSNALRAALSAYPADERSCLIYIHGFNVTFKEAALRAAQIGFDLKVPGAMTFFSWPSLGGGPRSYPTDADSIAASEAQLAEFVMRVSRAAGGARVHVLAHSMGNRGLLRVLDSVSKRADLAGVPFGQIFLAAPDVEANLFRQLAIVYPTISERTTLYVSKADRALSISASLHQNQRTGYAPPVMLIPGIDTIEVGQLDIGLLGHSYYGEASAVLYDMHSLMRTNLAPDRRAGLDEENTSSGGKFWSIGARRS
jgi:esterase/lipase superfamily enzyme